jgi:hypothetical protein
MRDPLFEAQLFLFEAQLFLNGLAIEAISSFEAPFKSRYALSGYWQTARVMKISVAQSELFGERPSSRKRPEHFCSVLVSTTLPV